MQRLSEESSSLDETIDSVFKASTGVLCSWASVEIQHGSLVSGLSRETLRTALDILDSKGNTNSSLHRQGVVLMIRRVEHI